MKYPRIWIAAHGGPIMAAAHEGAPSEVLMVLAEDDDLEVRIRVAANLKCPSVVLEKLATDDDWTIRRQVASHPVTPFVASERLRRDRVSAVRQEVVTTEFLRSAVHSRHGRHRILKEYNEDLVE